jgi:hypothetical protein
MSELPAGFGVDIGLIPPPDGLDVAGLIDIPPPPPPPPPPDSGARLSIVGIGGKSNAGGCAMGR